MIRAFSLASFALALSGTAMAAPQDATPAPVEQDFEAPSRGFKKGEFLPDVELPRVDGKGLVRLSDYAGSLDKPGKKLLLINFASW